MRGQPRASPHGGADYRAFNADVDGQSGLQELAGNATLLYYMSDEAKEFHRAQQEERKPDARKYPWLP